MPACALKSFTALGSPICFGHAAAKACHAPRVARPYSEKDIVCGALLLA